MDNLNEKTVRDNLKTNKKLKIIIVDEVVSTNTAVKEYGANGEDEGLVLIAQKQTCGKGRMGRSFFSPDKTGLYMSLLLKPSLPAEKSLYITTAAAVSAAIAIEKITKNHTHIKWVNDIFLNNKKVCGILTEASLCPETQGIKYAVLGVGINIYPPKNGFPDDLKSIAGSISDTGENLRARLASEFLNCFFEYYSNLADKAFYSEYINRSFIIGKKIIVTDSSESYDALVTGINEEFGLEVILKDGSRRTLNSGEVSIGSGNII